MSTFFIYPLDGQHLKEESASLGSNGLSRILEIPLSLLDADTNEMFNNKNATDQLFWLSTNNTPPAPALPTCETNNNTSDVTHSFANRKRSIVKRRKSVLSASYTAQDEAEAIKSDREATLAALERGTTMQNSSDEDSIKDNIMIEEKAPISRGTDRGVYMNTNTIYIQSEHDIDSPEQHKHEHEHEHEQQQQVVTAKDSAIDLRTTALEQDKSAFTLDAPMIESTCSSFTCPTPPPPPSPTLTPATIMTTKKKVSSWSPRRIFSSKNKEPTKQQEKFNISSLFSRSSSSPKKKTSTKSVLINHNPVISEKKEFQLKSNFNYTRLPIHTERAIYRLSHMKLTNPRRPLCDQVTISNLMFWYLSIISQQNNESNNSDLPPSIDSIVLTKKACHIQIHPRRPSKKRTSHKRIRNHQIGPDSNAMDTLNKQRHLSYRNTHLRTSNSSSDEEDEEGFSDDDLSDDDEDIMHNLYDKSKKKGGKKYSIFNYASNKNNNSWLSTFSPKQHPVSSTRQDEDDIPLAMYQKGKA